MYEQFCSSIYINKDGKMKAEKSQNESALVYAAQRGDTEALQLLLMRNWSWLRGLVYGVLNDANDVDDCLQDICVRVINKIDSLRQPERFRPWLAVLARRQALRNRQQRAARPAGLDDEVIQSQLDEKAKIFENIIDKEQCQQIIQAIKLLPEKYREVFMMQYSGDLTYAQIAEILDIPITTVQIRLVRARKMIYEKVMKTQINTGSLDMD